MNLENFVRYSMTFVASFAIGYANGLVARRFKRKDYKRKHIVLDAEELSKELSDIKHKEGYGFIKDKECKNEEC